MQTMDCRMALEHLFTYLDHPHLHQVELETAMRHFEGCPHCERKLGYLIRALNTAGKDVLTCLECEELWPEYLQAKTEGQINEDRWGAGARHLAACPYCSEEYATLSGLIALVDEPQTVPPPRYPEPDLSFLRSKKAEPPWHIDEWGRLIIQFSAELIQSWQPPTYGLAGLKTANSFQTLGRFSLEKTIEGLEVILTVEKKPDAATCTLIVQVDIPSRGGWPHLAGTEVTLKQNDLELETQLTDAFGRTVFEPIPLNILTQLAFQITAPPREA